MAIKPETNNVSYFPPLSLHNDYDLQEVGSQDSCSPRRITLFVKVAWQGTKIDLTGNVILHLESLRICVDINQIYICLGWKTGKFID